LYEIITSIILSFYYRGESAFFYLQIPIAWARRPMMERLDDLHPGLPVSLMYGTRSWFDNDTGKVFYSMRPGSYVDVHFVKGAGHHIHADAPVIFNEIVNSICRLSDEHKDVLMHDTIRTEEEAFITH
jgi:pimeloyl-ACP methyl ester carboxylesterase